MATASETGVQAVQAALAGIILTTAALQQVIDAALALQPATTDNDPVLFRINGVTMDHVSVTVH
jgi:hypothetical protein